MTSCIVFIIAPSGLVYQRKNMETFLRLLFTVQKLIDSLTAPKQCAQRADGRGGTKEMMMMTEKKRENAMETNNALIAADIIVCHLS